MSRLITSYLTPAKALQALAKVIQQASLTPDDAGIQAYLYSLSSPAEVITIDYSAEQVTNTLYVFNPNSELKQLATKQPTTSSVSGLPLNLHYQDLNKPYLSEQALCFAGHSDVVPVGKLEAWDSDPFNGGVSQGTTTAESSEQASQQQLLNLTNLVAQLDVLTQQFEETEESLSATTDSVALEQLYQYCIKQISQEENQHGRYRIHGRGATDMKSGLIAGFVAVKNFAVANPQVKDLCFFVTSDEEGIATHGTKVFTDHLAQIKQSLAYAIVGEPSSEQAFGDSIRSGRRGSITFRITVKGTQGHVAYPHLVDNPIHKASAFLADLSNWQLDQGNADFPPSSLQLVQLVAGDGTTNLVPAECKLVFNIRFNNLHTAASLTAAVAQKLAQHNLTDHCEVSTECSGEAFATAQDTKLVQDLKASIAEITGLQASCNTGGGTSDARFLAKVCPQVVEFGGLNATLHKVNEECFVLDFFKLIQVYQATFSRLRLPLSQQKTTETN